MNLSVIQLRALSLPSICVLNLKTNCWCLYNYCIHNIYKVCDGRMVVHHWWRVHLTWISNIYPPILWIAGIYKCNSVPMCIWKMMTINNTLHFYLLYLTGFSSTVHYTCVYSHCKSNSDVQYKHKHSSNIVQCSLMIKKKHTTTVHTAQQYTFSHKTQISQITFLNNQFI